MKKRAFMFYHMHLCFTTITHWLDHHRRISSLLYTATNACLRDYETYCNSARLSYHHSHLLHRTWTWETYIFHSCTGMCDFLQYMQAEDHLQCALRVNYGRLTWKRATSIENKRAGIWVCYKIHNTAPSYRSSCQSNLLYLNGYS